MSYKKIGLFVSLSLISWGASAGITMTEGQSFAASQKYGTTYCGGYKFSHYDCNCEINGHGIVPTALMAEAPSLFVNNISNSSFAFIAPDHATAKATCARKIGDMVSPSSQSQVQGKIECLEKTVKSEATGFLPIAQLFSELKMTVDTCAPDRITGFVDGRAYILQPSGGFEHDNGIKVTVTPKSGDEYTFKRSESEVQVTRLSEIPAKLGTFSVHGLKHVNPAAARKKYGAEFQTGLLRNLRSVEKYVESPQFETFCNRQADLKKIQSGKFASH